MLFEIDYVGGRLLYHGEAVYIIRTQCGISSMQSIVYHQNKVLYIINAKHCIFAIRRSDATNNARYRPGRY